MSRIVRTEPGAGVQIAVHFPVLDTMRAVGALAVLTTHAAFWSGAFTRNGVWGTLLARLDVGVAIFFVLSGFLLSRGYLARAATGLPPSRTRSYAGKRARRIVPVYLVTVVIALGLIGANDDLGVGDWVQTLLMLNIYTSLGMLSGLTQMWSLAVEVAFYVLLPLLMLPVVRGRRLHAGAVYVLLGAFVVVSLWWHLDGIERTAAASAGNPAQWLPGYLTWFGVGILFALAHVSWQQGTRGWLTRPLVAAARQPGSCWAMALGLLLVAATPIAGPSMLAAPTAGQSLTRTLIYAAIGGLLVVTGIFAAAESGYARAFSARWSRHLGEISYSVFCIHLPVLHLVMWATGWDLFVGRGPQIFGLTIVLSLVAAEVIYRLVELPSMRWRLRGRPSPRADQTSMQTSGTSTT